MGSSITLQCPTTNPSTIWLFSNDGINLFSIDNTDPNQYSINSQFSLTVFNLGLSNEGYYACGYSPTITTITPYITYNLFVKSKCFLFLVL